MAKNIYDKPIDKNVAWDGDATTEYKPVRGSRIEEFLKGALNTKAGVFYYDNSNNRYMIFADEESRDIYLSDTSQTELLLGTFDAPFNYSAEIHLTTPTYNAIAIGTSGNYLDYTFDIKNKEGVSTGENVNVTYTFTRGVTKRVLKETRKFGENVHLNIDEYLLEGTNVITIAIVGQSSLAATTAAITYQVVNLTLTDDMDISLVYDCSKGEQILTIPYTLSGQGTKTMEWYLDGDLIQFNVSEDEITDSLVSKTKYITFNNLDSGVHHLQFRAYTLIGGERFYTETKYREFIVNNGDITQPLIAIQTYIPRSRNIVSKDEKIVLRGIEQYIPYNLVFAVSQDTTVQINLGQPYQNTNAIGTISATTGTEIKYTLVTSLSGSLALTLTASKTVRIIDVDIAKTSLNIREITDGLEFYFTASGRSNSDTNKESWSYAGFQATLDGFAWDNQSGWVDGALRISNGASIAFYNYAPLLSDATLIGKTIELEFASRNVDDDDAVICDLRNANGTGMLLTASDARLISRVGNVVYTKFKSNERNRIAFVVNRSANVTNKNLVFVYVNGILSGAINYGSSDNYVSDAILKFQGTADAQIDLYSIRIYNTTLSNAEVLNNYILYRPSIDEMRNVYDANDILEDGTISLSQARRRLPVMLVTGDLLELDSKSDTDYYITVDIDYYNDQDPTKNFRIEGARMRIQGTSSRFYPRKNYRFYTNKADYTVLYDADGRLVEDGLYAFKDNAQAVDCWCLKADFAESSGTHNTGVARLWNEVMTNATFTHTNSLGQTVSGYPLRTKAQIAANNAGYTKDVRTTIDGFPILLFRRNDVGDDVVFVGKYNFNNDKSTPSVFGFEGIPDFDDRKVQSWEFLENEDPIALFHTTDGFFDYVYDADGLEKERWELAFEARHLGKNASIYDLKEFCDWMVSMRDNYEAFNEEKWEHLDVYKVAAYYCYLMRFGALDQVVKNCFLTSEDGEHYYFINYDNDTILGVDNTGEISALPDVDRQSRYANGSYVYAGHESVLWNMLESDEEFMGIVRIVDNALYSANLTLKNALDMFNIEQSAKWVERVYNEDAQYKYVTPYADKGVNYLTSLQGSRRSHRTWWLSKRFALYDSLFASGDFTAKAIEIKCQSGTPANLAIKMQSGANMHYGYGLNRVPRETGVYVAKGTVHTFVVNSELGIGTPVAIYAAPYIQGLDISAFTKYINTFNIEHVYDSNLGSRLKRLVLSDGVNENINVNVISGLPSATRLQELDIRNYKAITYLDLSSQAELKLLRASGSGLASATFAKGAPIETLELPSMIALELNQLPHLTTITLDNYLNLSKVSILDCPHITNDIKFVTNWLALSVVGQRELTMNNVAWDDVDYADLLKIGSIEKLNLRGYARLNTVSEEIVDSLIRVFGEGVFDKESPFYIDAPKFVYISGKSEILEGESTQYQLRVFPLGNQNAISFTLTTPQDGISISNNGLLTTTETGLPTKTITIKATANSNTGTLTATKTILVVQRVYPEESVITLVGSGTIEDPTATYSISTSYAAMGGLTPQYTGVIQTEWELSGELADYAYLSSITNTSCTIIVTQAISGVVSGLLGAHITKSNGDEICTKVLSINAVDSTIAETDAGVCEVLYNAGRCANPNYITKDEAAVVPDVFCWVNFRDNEKIQSFNGFKYFKSVRIIFAGAFMDCINMTSIRLPECSDIQASAFRNCKKLQIVELPSTLKTIGDEAFGNCILDEMVIPISTTSISRSSFNSCPLNRIIVEQGNEVYDSRNNCNALIETSTNTILQGSTNTIIPNSIVAISDNAFFGTFISGINLPKSVTRIGSGVFGACKNLKSVTVPSSLISMGTAIFAYCEQLESVTFERGHTNIPEATFMYCTKLKEIYLPSTITEIGRNVFAVCDELQTIVCEAVIAPIVYDTTFGSYCGQNNDYGTNVLYVPSSATGYTSGYWLDPLQQSTKCKFILSKTL